MPFDTRVQYYKMLYDESDGILSSIVANATDWLLLVLKKPCKWLIVARFEETTVVDGIYR